MKYIIILSLSADGPTILYFCTPKNELDPIVPTIATAIKQMFNATISSSYPRLLIVGPICSLLFSTVLGLCLCNSHFIIYYNTKY